MKVTHLSEQAKQRLKRLLREPEAGYSNGGISPVTDGYFFRWVKIGTEQTASPYTYSCVSTTSDADGVWTDGSETTMRLRASDDSQLTPDERVIAQLWDYDDDGNAWYCCEPQVTISSLAINNATPVVIAGPISPAEINVFDYTGITLGSDSGDEGLMLMPLDIGNVSGTPTPIVTPISINLGSQINLFKDTGIQLGEYGSMSGIMITPSLIYSGSTLSMSFLDPCPYLGLSKIIFPTTDLVFENGLLKSMAAGAECVLDVCWNCPGLIECHDCSGYPDITFHADVVIDGYGTFTDVPMAYDSFGYLGFLQDCDDGNLIFAISCIEGQWVWWMYNSADGVLTDYYPISFCTDPTITGGTFAAAVPIDNPDCGISGVYDIDIVISP